MKNGDDVSQNPAGNPTGARRDGPDRGGVSPPFDGGGVTQMRDTAGVGRLKIPRVRELS
ncbi:MAG: hypothetical protein QW186_06395 [Candidatus Bathyarchaeia archaeon]